MGLLAKRKKILFIGAVCLCIIIMLISALFREKPSFLEDAAGFVVIPVQKFLTDVGGWAEERIKFLSILSEIADENTRLHERINELETENSRLKLIEHDLSGLNELLALTQKYPEHETVGAEIIAKDPGNWYANFTVNKGRGDGFQKNMVVLAPGGLVGRIIETGVNYSKVRAIIDDTNAVSAKSARTGDTGVLRGDMRFISEGLCRMELIDIDAEIIAGDEIITSNLGDIYPPGLTIGFVTEINADAGGLTKYALVKPAVNFKHLETVLVINKLYIKELDGGGEETKQESDGGNGA